MNNRKFIIDKECHFTNEWVTFFIVGCVLLISIPSLLSYFTEPEYTSKILALDVGVFFLLLAAIMTVARTALRRYVYIDLEKEDIRVYFKFFAIKATYSISLIRDIQEVGVSSVRYSYSLDENNETSNGYYVVLLRKDGKVCRISTERSDLISVNKSVEKLAEKLQKPVCLGKENSSIYAYFDRKKSQYKLRYMTGLNAFLKRVNYYERSMIFLFALFSIILSVMPNG